MKIIIIFSLVFLGVSFSQAATKFDFVPACKKNLILDKSKDKTKVCKCIDLNTKTIFEVKGSLSFYHRWFMGKASEAEANNEKNNPTTVEAVEIEEECIKNHKWMAPKTKRKLGY